MSPALEEDHAAHLGRFRIPADLLERAGVRSVSDFEVRELFGINGHYRGHDLAGILFPYLSPLDGRRTGGRVRLDCPLSGSGKYLSEPGCRHIFFPPDSKLALSDTDVPVILVEAEKSAMALRSLADRTQRPMLPLALGGCWGWRRKIGSTPLPDGGTRPETGPSPDLDLLLWQNRMTIIAFDSNARSNPAVRKARWALAQELAARGARVLIADLRAESGVNGPDDLIAVSGDSAVLGVLDSARPFADCAIAEAELSLAALGADKKRDPLAVIEAAAAIEDAARRELLMGRVVALRIPGVTRKFVEQQIRQCRDETEAECKQLAARVYQSSLRTTGQTICGAQLLDEVYKFIRRFVLLSEEQARVVVLWIVHTHVFNAGDYTPYLAITSAEKRSGKTRLLEVLKSLTAHPWLTGRVSPAVLYRKIDAEHPTLLLDESDAAFNGEREYAEALRGVLNTGFQRSGTASCCVGKGAEMSYCDFSTFSPKAIAGIGRLPDTIADRAIPFRLKRAARHESIERFRLRSVGSEAANLRSQVEAWAACIGERIPDAQPELPAVLSDRQQDGAEPLLAIADAAGVEWPQRARHAFVELCTEAQAADDSIGVQLLSDIRGIFEERSVDRIASADLAGALAKIETSPWAEWARGKPISTQKLAQLLKPFGIAPGTIRLPEGSTAKGYYRDAFRDAFERYLPPEPPGTPPPDTPSSRTSGVSSRHNVTTRINTDDSCGFGDVTAPSCDGSKNTQNLNKNGPCDVVTASGGGIEDEL
jgi:hypothetical protein